MSLYSDSLFVSVSVPAGFLRWLCHRLTCLGKLSPLVTLLQLYNGHVFSGVILTLFVAERCAEYV